MAAAPPNEGRSPLWDRVAMNQQRAENNRQDPVADRLQREIEERRRKKPKDPMEALKAAFKK